MVALELCSCLSYVVAFRGVFCRRLEWRFSYEVGMAEQGTNVLVPAGGVGGLALGAWVLRQGGMAAERIARRSVSFRLIEAATGPQPGSRGKGIQPRTLEVFEDLSVVDRVLAHGRMAMPMRSTAADGS